MKIRKREKKKKENSTELQKSNIEAEVYNNNKNVTERKKNIKRLIWIHSANKVDSYNRVHQKGKDKIPKNLHNKSKHKNNKCCSWVTGVRVLFLSGSHSPPHLPRMPPNTVLISGPVVGTVQILIWSYSCILASNVHSYQNYVFSFVGALNDLLYIP